MNDKEFHTVRGYQLLEQNNKALTSAMEDYMEMIYRNSRKEGYMRLNKLAEQLNVKAPSASKMVQKLGELGLLKYEKYGIIILSESGKEIGEFLLSRHNIIEKFLKTIGIGDNLLIETELIEHNISLDTLKNIKLLNEFFEKNSKIMDMFHKYKEMYSGQGMS